MPTAPRCARARAPRCGAKPRPRRRRPAARRRSAACRADCGLCVGRRAPR